jgi:thymidylate synthase
MFISKKTVDDLLRTAFEKILKDGIRVKATKGWNIELSGVVLELLNPRARLSRTETKGTVFSCLGETLWYLAKTNELDFIEYYLHGYGKFSDDGRTIYGG